MLVEFTAEIAGIIKHTETVDTEEIRKEHGVSTYWEEYSERYRQFLLQDWWATMPVKLSYEEIRKTIDE